MGVGAGHEALVLTADLVCKGRQEEVRGEVFVRARSLSFRKPSNSLSLCTSMNYGPSSGYRVRRLHKGGPKINAPLISHRVSTSTERNALRKALGQVGFLPSFLLSFYFF